MDWTIRLAEAGEAAAVAELNGVVQALHHDERPDWFTRPDAAGFLPIVEAWLESPEVRVVVADDGQALAGYAIGTRQVRADSPLKHGAVFVELDQVVVAPSARENGIGRALCDAVVAWAAEQGASRVELGTWAFNDRAHRLFQDLGFTPTVIRMSLGLDRRLGSEAG